MNISQNYNHQKLWNYMMPQKRNRKNKECWKYIESESGWSSFSLMQSISMSTKSISISTKVWGIIYFYA